MLKDKKREKSKVLNRVIHIYRLVLRTERSWGGGGGRGCHCMVQATGNLSSQKSSKSEHSCVYLFSRHNLFKQGKDILMAL